MFLKKANIYFKNVDKIVLKVEFLSEHNWNPIKIQWTAVKVQQQAMVVKGEMRNWSNNAA